MANLIGNTTVTPLAISQNNTTVKPAVYDSGDVAWILTSTALVFLMIPGVGYFYSGLAKSKSSLSLIMLSMWSVAIVSVQWFMFGYSLTFSKSGNGGMIIGDFTHLFLNGVNAQPYVEGAKIPELVFCVYQMMFAAITPALAIGAAAERGRFLPSIVFIFIWTTVVYDVTAMWTWNPNSWTFKFGGLDFAGGTPVHIASGAAALAYAVVLGHRADEDKLETKPHNMANVALGTALIWFGWFGFNGGSALASNMRSVMALVVTNLSASIGGLTWALLDYRHERKFSALAFCSGAIAGLVCITPGSGFVSPASSLVFGSLGAISCHFALKLKNIFPFDDALDVFALHGVGGIVGNLLTGIFAQQSIASLDGTLIPGGWLDGNWIQLAYQAVDTGAGLSWSFVLTYIILFIMNKIPGLSLRVDPEVERLGLDQVELGFRSYEFVEESKSTSSLPRESIGKSTSNMNTSKMNYLMFAAAVNTSSNNIN